MASVGKLRLPYYSLPSYRRAVYLEFGGRGLDGHGRIIGSEGRTSMAKSLARVAFASLLLALTVFGSKAESSSGGVGPDASCASSSPCLSVQNSGTGTAVEGKSTAGNGISGVTKTASSSSFLGSGVEGDDLGSGSYNAGGLGTSTNGIGVYGTCRNHIGIARIGGVSSLVGQSSTPGVVGEVANQSFGLF